MSRPKDLAASVAARLSNYARDHNSTYQEVLQYYAIERFLYRLAQSEYRDAFVLKGGVAFFAWRFPIRRSTRDIDLHGVRPNTIEQIVRIVRDICKQTVHPDGMRFDANSVAAVSIQERAKYQGIRVRFNGYLGTARVSMQLDIGFSDVLDPPAISVEYPTILEMSSPRLKAYRWETLIAEKFQTMVFLGSINSRMKDFYDIWLLTYESRINGPILQKAIVTTFKNRATQLPGEFPLRFLPSISEEKQAQWHAFVDRENLTFLDLDHFPKIIDRLRDFLTPLLEAQRQELKFDKDWNPEKGWHDE